MARDKYLEKFIDAQFSDLKEHLARDRNENRLAFSNMSVESDARHADNQGRLSALEKDMGFLKTLFKGVCAILAAGASAVGLWKGLR